MEDERTTDRSRVLSFLWVGRTNSETEVDTDRASHSHVKPEVSVIDGSVIDSTPHPQPTQLQRAALDTLQMYFHLTQTSPLSIPALISLPPSARSHSDILPIASKTRIFLSTASTLSPSNSRHIPPGAQWYRLFSPAALTFALLSKDQKILTCFLTSTFACAGKSTRSKEGKARVARGAEGEAG